jgi:hypothetical protein
MSEELGISPWQALARIRSTYEQTQREYVDRIFEEAAKEIGSVHCDGQTHVTFEPLPFQGICGE